MTLNSCTKPHNTSIFCRITPLVSSPRNNQISTFKLLNLRTQNRDISIGIAKFFVEKMIAWSKKNEIVGRDGYNKFILSISIRYYLFFSFFYSNWSRAGQSWRTTIVIISAVVGRCIPIIEFLPAWTTRIPF